MEGHILLPKNYTQLEMYLNYNKIDISKIIVNTYYDLIYLINDWSYLSNHLDINNEDFIYFIKNPRKLVSKIVAVKLYTRKYNINRIELIQIIKNIINSFDFKNPSLIIYSDKIIPPFYLKFTINNFNKLIKLGGRRLQSTGGSHHSDIDIECDADVCIPIDTRATSEAGAGKAEQALIS